MICNPVPIPSELLDQLNEGEFLGILSDLGHLLDVGLHPVVEQYFLLVRIRRILHGVHLEPIVALLVFDFDFNEDGQPDAVIRASFDCELNRYFTINRCARKSPQIYSVFNSHQVLVLIDMLLLEAESPVNLERLAGWYFVIPVLLGMKQNSSQSICERTQGLYELVVLLSACLVQNSVNWWLQRVNVKQSLGYDVLWVR